MRHKGQVYSANDLLNHVWSSESDSSEDAVRQVITRLRRKLGDDSQTLIVTVKNLGYKIDE
jgi:DNA-binding response OmpR family regulator